MNDPHENATWVYNYDRGGNILSKVKYVYTEGELGEVVENIPYEYTDSNWKDKLTAYNGQAITYDAIGNPLDDGERQYEWEAGRRLKKMIVQGDPADGIEDGFDEGSATTLKLEFSNGNLLMGETSNTVISAKVYRKDVDVTDEYAATAFNWTRTSGNESADASWNAAHSGMKSITVSANELSDDIQIQCTLTGTSSSYGSVDVNEQFVASHTRSVADSNDTLSIEDGTLFVTTNDDNYRLSDNELTALYPRLNGSVSANAWVYHSQPTKTIEFKYNSAGLRVQKKVAANGKTEVTDYTLHGKLVTHMTVGSDKLHFFYDAQSRPAKVNFNGTTYTYLHNLQGDIVGILDNTGNLVVEYKYDAWGKLLSTTGSLADTLGIRNPFRYRGYVFDEESGLYYLGMRYYSPELYRFLNADVVMRARNGLYTYCRNSPIGYYDPNGAQEAECCENNALSIDIYVIQGANANLLSDIFAEAYMDVDLPSVGTELLQSIHDAIYSIGKDESVSQLLPDSVGGLAAGYLTSVVSDALDVLTKRKDRVCTFIANNFVAARSGNLGKYDRTVMVFYYGHGEYRLQMFHVGTDGIEIAKDRSINMELTDILHAPAMRTIHSVVAKLFKPVYHGHPKGLSATSIDYYKDIIRRYFK